MRGCAVYATQVKHGLPYFTVRQETWPLQRFYKKEKKSEFYKYKSQPDKNMQDLVLEQHKECKTLAPVTFIFHAF